MIFFFFFSSHVFTALHFQLGHWLCGVKMEDPGNNHLILTNILDPDQPVSSGSTLIVIPSACFGLGPFCSNFRIITAVFFGCRKFLDFYGSIIVRLMQGLAEKFPV